MNTSPLDLTDEARCRIFNTIDELFYSEEKEKVEHIESIAFYLFKCVQIPDSAKAFGFTFNFFDTKIFYYCANLQTGTDTITEAYKFFNQNNFTGRLKKLSEQKVLEYSRLLKQEPALIKYHIFEMEQDPFIQSIAYTK